MKKKHFSLTDSNHLASVLQFLFSTSSFVDIVEKYKKKVKSLNLFSKLSAVGDIRNSSALEKISFYLTENSNLKINNDNPIRLLSEILHLLKRKGVDLSPYIFQYLRKYPRTCAHEKGVNKSEECFTEKLSINVSNEHLSIQKNLNNHLEKKFQMSWECSSCGKIIDRYLTIKTVPLHMILYIDATFSTQRFMVIENYISLQLEGEVKYYELSSFLLKDDNENFYTVVCKNGEWIEFKKKKDKKLSSEKVLQQLKKFEKKQIVMCYTYVESLKNVSLKRDEQEDDLYHPQQKDNTKKSTEIKSKTSSFFSKNPLEKDFYQKNIEKDKKKNKTFLLEEEENELDLTKKDRKSSKNEKNSLSPSKSVSEKPYIIFNEEKYDNEHELKIKKEPYLSLIENEHNEMENKDQLKQYQRELFERKIENEALKGELEIYKNLPKNENDNFYKKSYIESKLETNKLSRDLKFLEKQNEKIEKLFKKSTSEIEKKKREIEKLKEKIELSRLEIQNKEETPLEKRNSKELKTEESNNGNIEKIITKNKNLSHALNEKELKIVELEEKLKKYEKNFFGNIEKNKNKEDTQIKAFILNEDEIEEGIGNEILEDLEHDEQLNLTQKENEFLESLRSMKKKRKIVESDDSLKFLEKENREIIKKLKEYSELVNNYKEKNQKLEKERKKHREEIEKLKNENSILLKRNLKSKNGERTKAFEVHQKREMFPKKKERNTFRESTQSNKYSSEKNTLETKLYLKSITTNHKYVQTDKIKDKGTELQSRISLLELDVHELSSKNMVLRASLNNQSERILNRDVQIKQKEQQFNSQNNQFVGLSKTYEEQVKNNKELEAENEKLVEKTQNLKKKLENIEIDHQRDIKRNDENWKILLSSKDKEVKKYIDMLNENKGKSSDLLSDIYSLRDENQKLKFKIQKMELEMNYYDISKKKVIQGRSEKVEREKEFIEFQNKFADKMNDKNQIIIELKRRNTELEDKLANNEKKKEGNGIEKLEDKMVENEKKMKEMEKLVESLKKNLNEKNEKVLILEKENEELKNLLLSAKKKYKKLKTEKEEENDCNKKTQHLKQIIQELEKRIKEEQIISESVLIKQRKKFENQFEHAKRKNEMENQILFRKFEELKNSIKELQEENKTLRRNNDIKRKYSLDENRFIPSKIRHDNENSIKVLVNGKGFQNKKENLKEKREKRLPKPKSFDIIRNENNRINLDIARKSSHKRPRTTETRKVIHQKNKNKNLNSMNLTKAFSERYYQEFMMKKFKAEHMREFGWNDLTSYKAKKFREFKKLNYIEDVERKKQFWDSPLKHDSKWREKHNFEKKV